MDEQLRAAALGEIATQAGIERASFLNDAARQLDAFLHENREHIRELGGLVLIDDEPEYLAITAEGTFRSRTRYQDDAGEWVAETEVIESAGEIVEIYNPSDIYAAFAEAARIEAGLEPEPTAAEDLLEVAGVASEVGVEQEGQPEPAEGWAGYAGTPSTKDDAARMLYDLALTFQERSQRAEARLLDDFQDASENLAGVLGDSMVLEDDDERLWFRASGAFEAEVVPEVDGEGEGGWQPLTSSGGARPVLRSHGPLRRPGGSPGRPAPRRGARVRGRGRTDGDEQRRATRARARRLDRRALIRPADPTTDPTAGLASIAATTSVAIANPGAAQLAGPRAAADRRRGRRAHRITRGPARPATADLAGPEPGAARPGRPVRAPAGATPERAAAAGASRWPASTVSAAPSSFSPTSGRRGQSCCASTMATRCASTDRSAAASASMRAAGTCSWSATAREWPACGRSSTRP